MLSEIKYIVIHCSATKPKVDVGVKEIDTWHKAQGWRACGYHFIVRLDGTIETGRDLREVGAHVSGYNNCSIGICYIGGLDDRGKPADTRTTEQELALQSLVRWLSSLYPDAKVVGHNDLNPKKACPCFNVRSWFHNI